MDSNAVKHNKPESPNVVRCWADQLEFIPECALKTEAIHGITEALLLLTPAFSKAFTELREPSKPGHKPSAKPSSKPSRKPSPNQEQEQEQEQKQEDTLALTAIAVPAAAFLTLPLNKDRNFRLPINVSRIGKRSIQRST